jgi:tetratricopeptide (TPR) repeat protein
LAAARGAQDGAAAARDTLLPALDRARDWGDDALIGLALSRLCEHAARQNQLDEAVEYGWGALRLLSRGGERTRVLLHLSGALIQLGLFKAAERCYSLVAQRASDPAARAAAQTGLAVAAATSGQTSVFQDRRLAALRDLQQAPRLTRAGLQLDLAEATLSVGGDDFAREHVRDALALLGSHGPRALTRRAESVLQRLELAVELARRPALEVPEQTRRIAAELELVADSMVAAE